MFGAEQFSDGLIGNAFEHGQMFLRNSRWAEIFGNRRALFTMWLAILIKDRVQAGLSDILCLETILQEVFLEQIFGFGISSNMPDAIGIPLDAWNILVRAG